MKINDYFEYWDAFFTIWKNSKNQTDYDSGFKKLKLDFQKYTFPYPQKIMNCDCNAIETFEYVPEPYWGWTPELKTDLEFVVVNYNPASGGEHQHRNSKNICSIKKYSEYVKQQIIDYVNCKNNSKSPRPSQYETTNWHFNNRAKKLAELNSKKVSNDNSSIKNYLGIDLVPWHTKNVNSLNGYLEEHFKSIQNWSLNFAIQAAQEIKSESKLKNKVIVRTNLKTFKELFKNEFQNGKLFIEGESKTTNKGNNDNYQQIKINGSEVTLILLWGMRNSLPTKEFMEQILNLK